jgi:two-component system response regulator AtoC
MNALPANVLHDIRIFLVDDEDILAWSIETELKALGAEVLRAASVRQALERFPGFQADLAITDLRLPDGNGLDLLQKWRKEQPDLPVILITAHGAIDSAVTALRLGAFDYLQKPFDMKDLLAAVKRASEVAQLRQKVSRMEGREKTRDQVTIVGESAAIKSMRDRVQKVASSRANSALILGDSGTGKELAARAVHMWSDRATQPFVEINCASIPETLLESELFGFEKGAFTDARERKLGLFEMARGGTIFLDEIGEMPLKLQSKLLRALEYRRFKRLGGTKDIEFSARIVAATNRNLIEEVSAGRFRSDLFYRLNVLPIRIPTLAERKDDIPLLVDFFLKGLAEELGTPLCKCSAQAMEKLKSHNWPGNIRELRNVLQRAIVFHEPREITAAQIEIESMPTQAPRLSAEPQRPALDGARVSAPADIHSDHDDAVPESQAIDSNFVLPETGVRLEALERSLLTQALEKARNNQTRAAQLLGISRHTLRYRLEKHGLLHAGM